MPNDKTLIAILDMMHDLAVESASVIDRHRRRLFMRIAEEQAEAARQAKAKKLHLSTPPAVTELWGNDRLTVSVKEAKDAIGVSPQTIYNLINTGKLQSTKIAGKRVIYVASLKKLVGIES